MASRYIPPALRAQGRGGSNANASGGYHSGNSATLAYPVSGLRGGEGNTRPLRRRSDVPNEDVYSLKQIDRYFWPEGDSKTAFVEHSKTLHDSATSPGKLAYVLLFNDANPRWESDNIIFTKSSLDLLPAELAKKAETTTPTSEPVATSSIWTDEVIDSLAASNGVAAQERDFGKAETQEAESVKMSISDLPARHDDPKSTSQQQLPPIAIFSQGARFSKLRPSFTFQGYYRITNLQFLEPNTPDLARMLQQKWTVTNQRTGRVHERQRDMQSWEKSFNLRWAVVKFEKDETADKKLGKPQIERLKDDEEDDIDAGREKKSVNDMLRELSMKDSNAKEEKNDGDNKIEKETTISAHAAQENPKQETHAGV
ncbi:hypothetical protein H2200_000903 [Cladophialophora chaetospira]|uniref:Uncharacterized protein n=1 Tax=Cladophialophora chaetospira TaxID=386627 RepID=A0AA38XPF0_9EURO|nr:hypothetical protein H2200_000903 [Cladophialophora chaetospira]